MSATRSIAGRDVFPIGFGGWPLASESRPDRATSLRVLHAALDAGCRLFDTAIAYCADSSETGHNERLIAEAVRTWSGANADVVIATKGGAERDRRGAWCTRGTPADLRRQCEASLRSLDVDVIDLYQLHETDPRVAFDDQVAALAALRDEGKIRAIGLSNVQVDEVVAAGASVEIASVQNEFGPHDLSDLATLRYCEESGITYLPYSPLGGPGAAARLGDRFPAFAAVGARHRVSPQRVALAWLLALSPCVVPIPGARRVETALDSLAAADLRLDDEDRGALPLTSGAG